MENGSGKCYIDAVLVPTTVLIMRFESHRKAYLQITTTIK